jgi:hypothetical protein
MEARPIGLFPPRCGERLDTPGIGVQWFQGFCNTMDRSTGWVILFVVSGRPSRHGFAASAK